MPKFYCDYCDAYLTHDSQHGRKQHARGWKHRENFKTYYQHFYLLWSAEQQKLQQENYMNQLYNNNMNNTNNTNNINNLNNINNMNNMNNLNNPPVIFNNNLNTITNFPLMPPPFVGVPINNINSINNTNNINLIPPRFMPPPAFPPINNIININTNSNIHNIDNNNNNI